jgi:predicted PurR-regulated permease PerM
MVVAELTVDRTRAAWLAFGAILAVAVGFVVYSFVGTVVFGIFLYYATRPVYRRLRHRVGPPSVAAAIAIFALALPVLLLFAYTLAIALQEFGAVSEQANLGALESYASTYVNVSAVAEHPERLLDQAGGFDAISGVLDEALTYLGFFGNGALHLFVIVAMAFYLLRDGHKLSRWFHATFDDDSGVLESYTYAVDRDFKNVFFGNILNAILTAAIGAISYTVLDQFFAPPGIEGIPYAALFGILTGAASLIPVVGMKLVYFPLSGYLFYQWFQSGSQAALWFLVLFVGVSFLIVDVIPDLVLRPYVSGRNLHVGSVMLAYIFGPLLFGWYGIFLGPMLLILAVHFVKVVLPELVSDEEFHPYSVDPTYLSGPVSYEAGAEPAGSPVGDEASVESDGGSRGAE